MTYFPQGLKTGMYYLRTKPAANAIQFTVDKTKVSKTVGSTPSSQNGTSNTNGISSSEKNMADMVCSLENKDACLSCGS